VVVCVATGRPLSLAMSALSDLLLGSTVLLGSTGCAIWPQTPGPGALREDCSRPDSRLSMDRPSHIDACLVT
jgi:hypothetical protein